MANNPASPTAAWARWLVRKQEGSWSTLEARTAASTEVAGLDAAALFPAQDQTAFIVAGRFLSSQVTAARPRPSE